MPTRKQRRRRDKTFRHEYGFVTYDEEGNEVEVDPSAVREKKEPKPKPAAQAKGKGRSPVSRRVPEPPSWNRALRRGGLWGAIALVGSVVLFHNIVVGIVYAVMFVPLTYLIDRTTWRMHVKRTTKT